MSLTRCTCCARRCGADRTRTPSKAACHIGRFARLADSGPGRLVFAGCSLGCLFCPSPAANRQGEGDELDTRALAAAMAARAGHLLDLVHPSHVALQILDALDVLGPLAPPLAWVSSGFDGLETLRRLEGRIAVYRPEAKFGDSAIARMVAGVSAYAETNRAVITEMLRQVGPMQPGMPDRGVLVRHRVLPHDLASTARALAFLPPGTPVRILDDYRPAHRADRHPRLNRPPSAGEIAAARDMVRQCGLMLWE
jgi:putative pyruvate formate lyase activating enzyme